MTEIHQAGIILLITAIVMVVIVGIAGIVALIITLKEIPKKERKGLKCLAGIHDFRYARSHLRASGNSSLGFPISYRPKKVFSTSYYNKKVSFCVKYCLKCLKFKAEKI